MFLGNKKDLGEGWESGTWHTCGLSDKGGKKKTGLLSLPLVYCRDSLGETLGVTLIEFRARDNSADKGY